MENERFPYASRSWDVKIRDLDETGRTIFGTVVPYGEVARVDDGEGPYDEAFDFGSTTRSVKQTGAKVPLYPQHNKREFPLTRGAEWTEHQGGLDGAFKLPDTTAARDTLTLVQEGIVDSFSVGFRGISARQDGNTTVRTEVALVEVSLVASPAYQSAKVAGIRAEDLTVEQIEEWLHALTPSSRAALEAAFSVPASDGTDGSPTGPANGTAARQLNRLRAEMALLTL
jgi:uncharacterized protein